MRQGDNIRYVVVKTETMSFADYCIELFYRHDLGDRQFTDGQDKLRFEQLQFGGEPFCTIIDFILLWNPIPAAGIFTRETTTTAKHGIFRMWKFSGMAMGLT